MTDPVNESADQLRGFIRRVLNLREERKAITGDIAAELKEARLRGYDSKKIGEVCLWLERVDKHGRDAMLMAEEMFELYREIAEQPDKPIAEQFEAERDKVLAEMFASPPPDDKPKQGKRLKAANDAAVMARAAKIARGE